MKITALLSGLLAAVMLLPATAETPKPAQGLRSGVEKGEVLLPFHPKHVVGPDTGTKACPV